MSRANRDEQLQARTENGRRIDTKSRDVFEEFTAIVHCNYGVGEAIFNDTDTVKRQK